MSTAIHQSELGRLITDAIQQINGSDAPARLHGDTLGAIAREPARPNEPIAQPIERPRLDNGPPSFGRPISSQGRMPIDGNRKAPSVSKNRINDRENGKHVGPIERGAAISRGVSAFGRQMARAWAIVDRALAIQNRGGAMIAVCAAVLIFIF